MNSKGTEIPRRQLQELKNWFPCCWETPEKMQTTQNSNISYSCRSVASLMLYASTTVRNKLLHEIPYFETTFPIILQVLARLYSTEDHMRQLTIVSLELKHKYESLCDFHMKVPWTRDTRCFLLSSLYLRAQF